MGGSRSIRRERGNKWERGKVERESTAKERRWISCFAHFLYREAVAAAAHQAHGF